MFFLVSCFSSFIIVSAYVFYGVSLFCDMALDALSNLIIFLLKMGELFALLEMRLFVVCCFSLLVFYDKISFDVNFAKH